MTRARNASPSLWTFTMLTIPARELYLANLLASIASLPMRTHCEVVVIYNAVTTEEHDSIERRICAMAPTLPIRVYLNSTDPTIGGGRRLQLGVCRTPLVAFMDDDLTLHGDVVGTLEAALISRPLGIVGLPSYNEDTAELFKPRESTPYVNLDGIRYMPVQGMLVAGYRRLFADIGGFNPRRQFWGEWTELNLRMWRHGFPTGYAMDGAFLRHWHKAPESPTRNMAGREQHVLWGLICTALEYDAVSVNEATETFWRLAQDRYLAYSFGEQPSSRQLLTSVLQLMPRLSSEFPAIHAFAQEAHRHRFHFKPFEPLTAEQVGTVLAFAEQAVFAYRPDLLRTTDSTPAGWWSRMRRRLAKPTLSEKQPKPTEPATVAETASETSDQEG